MCIDVNRQDVPCVQGLSVACLNVEGCDLVLCEAELRCIVDVLPEERVELVGVQGAIRT